MMDALDELDLALVHALAVDGRAPFSRIAAALDRSDRTVAHRYRRLRAAGMRVVGVTDERRLGLADWLVRIRCAPDAAPAVATALARRDDTAWVGIASGGTELTCITRTPSGADHLLLRKLSRTPRIDSVTAQCMLRPLAGTAGWQARTSALTQPQIDQIRGPHHPAPRDPVDLTDSDHALFHALAIDGRTGYPALAATTGTSESTVRRRLSDLRHSGTLRFDVDIDPALLGYTCQAVLHLTVTPGSLTTVAAALAKHPEIAYATATTGSTNIAAFAVCRDLDGLYDYLTTGIGTLDGVLRLDTSPITRHVKRAGAIP